MINKKARLLAAAFLILILLAPAQSKISLASSGQDQIVAILQNQKSVPDTQELTQSLGFTLARAPFQINNQTYVLLLETPAGNNGEAQKSLLKLRQNPQVLAADFNYQRRLPPAKLGQTASGQMFSSTETLNFVPNDPLYGDGQWNLHEDHANFPPAWNLSTGEGAVIAILDTGAWLKHPDLWGKIVSGGYDFVNEDADPSDDHGHGTWTAGIAGAATNNGLGIAGAGFNAQILSLKVLRPDETGGATGNDYDIVRAILYAAIRDEVSVISMSFAGPAYSQTLEYAVNYAYNLRGKTLIASVGYEANGIVTYPAGFANVLAVTNVGYYNEHGDDSTTGTWLIGHAVSAPGIEIWTTHWETGILPERYFIKATGNSFATPHVSGLAAFLCAQGKPNWWVKGAILQTARPLGDPRIFGEGLIDAGAAMEAVVSPPRPLHFKHFLPFVARR